MQINSLLNQQAGKLAALGDEALVMYRRQWVDRVGNKVIKSLGQKFVRFHLHKFA